MINIGWFSEMECHSDNGSIKEYICENVDYDKEMIINYLSQGNKIASCPRKAIDCISGEKISESFCVMSDGTYCWGDFLLYHIRKYNIKLPHGFINKVAIEEARRICNKCEYSDLE